MTWIKWRIVYFLDWLYGERVCWAQLVMWIMLDYEWESVRFDTPCGDNTYQTYPDGHCFCGKFGQRVIPEIPPIFWIIGY